VNPLRIEFQIPRRAADALPISAMSAQARALGISPSRIEVGTAKVGRGKLRVTCSREMAIFLADQFRELVVKAGDRKEPLLLIDAALAVSSIVAALDEAKHGDESAKTDSSSN